MSVGRHHLKWPIAALGIQQLPHRAGAGGYQTKWPAIAIWVKCFPIDARAGARIHASMANAGCRVLALPHSSRATYQMRAVCVPDKTVGVAPDKDRVPRKGSVASMAVCVPDKMVDCRNWASAIPRTSEDRSASIKTASYFKGVRVLAPPGGRRILIAIGGH